MVSTHVIWLTQQVEVHMLSVVLPIINEDQCEDIFPLVENLCMGKHPFNSAYQGKPKSYIVIQLSLCLTIYDLHKK